MKVEITKEFKTTTKILGTNPCIGMKDTFEGYVKDNINKAALSFFQQDIKKGEEIEETIMRVLSTFHRDENGFPIMGGWMVKKCLVNTATYIFNASKNKTHPKRELVQNVAIGEVSPINISLYNGKVIKNHTGIDTYAVTIRDQSTGKPRSFFKAYEYIEAGITGEVCMQFDEDLFNGEDNINFLLDKCGTTGIGAFRQRFGKFQWVN